MQELFRIGREINFRLVDMFLNFRDGLFVEAAAACFLFDRVRRTDETRFTFWFFFVCRGVVGHGSIFFASSRSFLMMSAAALSFEGTSVGSFSRLRAPT